MSKPILNLSDSSKWESLWFGSFSALEIPDKPGYTYEISPILIPILFENRIVVITISSETAKPRWKYAGKVRQKIQTGITVGGRPDVSSTVTKKVFLDQNNLLIFPLLTPTYALEVEPIFWLTQISLSAWIYTGIDTDTVTEQLNQIELAIEELDA